MLWEEKTGLGPPTGQPEKTLRERVVAPNAKGGTPPPRGEDRQ